MRAVPTLTAVFAALIGCPAASSGSASETSLRIAYWEGDGVRPDVVWTLRCNPARGTLFRPARACRRLEAGGPTLFAPIPPRAACTEIYGGPQRARVTGLLEGRRIWASFARTNGCHIARWARVSPWLLPPGGET